MADAGFDAPLPIEREATPGALEGRDVLGLARTGTGKATAFAIPIIGRLLGTSHRGPRALILSPTREFVHQIEDATLAGYPKIRAATVFGGDGAGPQIGIACPGRQPDLIQRSAIQFDQIELLVIGEADRMFGAGSLPDIRRVVASLPDDRQNLLFSAAMPKEVEGSSLLASDRGLDVARVARVAHFDHRARRTPILTASPARVDPTAAVRCSPSSPQRPRRGFAANGRLVGLARFRMARSKVSRTGREVSSPWRPGREGDGPRRGLRATTGAVSAGTAHESAVAVDADI